MNTKNILEVKSITLAYDRNVVVRNISFKIKKGLIGCLLGPSGCGKTTIFRAIAGFETVREGEIFLNETLVSSKEFLLPPEKRRLGIVFQDNSLYPHLSVEQNIAFGLFRYDKQKRSLRVNELLKLTGLADQSEKYPHQLSGGQQQRVALARALAPEPELILLDEPFSNLDGELRERLNQEVKLILKTTGTSAILVTHDQLEAFSIADEIGVLENGQIQQWDSAYNIYNKPANPFVADFIGRGILVPGIAEDNFIKIESGKFKMALPDGIKNGDKVEVLIRPADVVYTDDNKAIKVTIKNKAYRGEEYLYTLELAGGQKILSLMPSHLAYKVGEEIGIKLNLKNIVVFRKG
ncbi:MAG: ABC transporter ATP-binding protein [Ignavibacterium sp.]|nr:ABC transporter ATP-binding protein [Ignavibacterium sp.]